ncbi:Nudix hydrolase 20 [Citrus sinensis]|nr:Nudix hydrolase 20 [Citrus sinensis]
MASNVQHLTQTIRLSFPSLHNFKASDAFTNKSLITTFPVRFSFHSSAKLTTSIRSLPVATASISYRSSCTFTWDDVVRVSQPEYSPDDSSDLRGYFEKIKICNRGSEMQSEFFPFIIEDQVVGYTHNRFASHLRKYDDVFIYSENNGGRFGSHLKLNSKLKTADERTRVVGEVIKCLGEEDLIPGIRNELYPVTSTFGSPIFFSLERAAAPYFGIKAYGVHMNGYVEKDGQKFLWIGKRSQVKPTYPGMLDHLVAGGLPHGIACGENIIKECEEEAGIPRSISNRARPVGAVSYMDINGFSYKRDVLFCYDLKLPEDFVPKNQGNCIKA